MAADDANSVTTLMFDPKQFFRSDMKQLEDEMTAEMKNMFHKSKEDRYKAKEDQKYELSAKYNEFVTRFFDKVHKNLCVIEENIKNYTSKKPRKEECKFMEKVDDYSILFELGSFILCGLMDLFNVIVEKVQYFLNSLWEWIKEGMTNIAQRVKDFFVMIVNIFVSGIERLLE